MNTPSKFLTGEESYSAYGIYNISSPLVAAPPSEKRVGLTAYHVLSTAPYMHKNFDKPYELGDFELITARLSAMAWRKYNGEIYLVTDETGEEYIRSLGIENDWNGIIPILDLYNGGIDPGRFWASGKILALGELRAPCTIIDLDLIVWKPLDLSDTALAVMHIEHIDAMVYPNPEIFILSKNYNFNPQWDFSVEPLNTAFLY